MSFSNDEDGDGLAALFGGITPQGAPSPEPGRRRAATEPATESAPAPEQSAAPPAPAPGPAPQYPGLAPDPYAPPTFSPGAPAPAGPVSPAYEMPAPAQPPQVARPQFPQTPQSYEMPAPPPAPAAPAYGAPVAPQYPGLAPTPAPYPSDPYPSVQPPQATTPSAANPPATSEPPPYPGPAAPSPAYPPTAQYPAGIDPALPTIPEPSPAAEQPPASEAPPPYRPPAYDPPVPSRAEDTAHSAPEPIVEPPAFGGFEALGLQPSASSGFGEPEVAGSPGPGSSPAFGGGAAGADPRQDETHAEARAAENPLVRADPAPLATVFPPGPLLPEPTRTVETPEQLRRATVVEKIGLVVAVLAGPIGLVMAVVTAVRGVRRRGWLIGVGRASLVLAVLSTILAGIGGYALWNLRLDQLQRDEVAAASAEFCAAGDADPALVSAPLLGWPRPGATITESLALMQAWTDNWAALSATSPAELRDGLDLLTTRGQTIIDAVAGSRIVDDETNEQQITSIEAQSGVSNWYATYCVEP